MFLQTLLLEQPYKPTEETETVFMCLYEEFCVVIRFLQCRDLYINTRFYIGARYLVSHLRELVD